MDSLEIRHNAGMFSCCSIALEEIIGYFNKHHKLPFIVDRNAQFSEYKIVPSQNLTEMYFEEKGNQIAFNGGVQISSTPLEPQFSPYNLLNLEEVKPFIDKYFSPSQIVKLMMAEYEEKYSIDYSNTCAVFYRGNDKARETKIASYSEFINKAKEVKSGNPDVRFLVQPDETEFLVAFLNEFPEAIYFEETPHIRKKDSVIFNEMPRDQRAQYGAQFLAAVLCLSKSKYLITHSGNGGIWSVLFRGNTDNVRQWLTDKWI